MILQSLVTYYESLERKGKITSPGWCSAKISFALELSEAGELLRIIPLKESVLRGKKTASANDQEGSADGGSFLRRIGQFSL